MEEQSLRKSADLELQELLSTCPYRHCSAVRYHDPLKSDGRRVTGLGNVISSFHIYHPPS